MAGGSPTIKERRERPWLWALPLFTLGLALIFGPSWGAPTFFANENSILRLPLLSNWHNLPIIFSQDFMPFSDGMYRPASYALVAVLRTVVSANAFRLWHTILLALHVLNTWMVFRLTRHFVKQTPASLLAASVFCFHPLSAVLVNDINHLHLLLGLSFYLGTLLLVFAHGTRKWLPYFVFALITFFLGLLTSTIVITLPLVLIVYEVVYQRLRRPRVILPIVVFFVFGLLAIVLWAYMKPPPLLYSYPVEPEGALPSFLSLVAGGRWYALGILFGWQVPAVVGDLIPLVSSWRDPGFLCWSGVSVLLLGVAFWRMARRDPMGLGLFLIFAMMTPFATTAWNPVKEYGAWAFLYGSVAGLAIVVGGLAKHALSVRRTWLRHTAIVFLLLLVIHNAPRLSRINYATRSPLAYWQYVLALNERSKTVQVELGKAYLASGDPDKAAEHLFTPDVDSLEESCLAMCRYYFQAGDLWAASIHCMFAKDDLAKAQIWEALNCLDHAEYRLGLVLARNPFDTIAMKRLAGVFARKGFVSDARSILSRVLDIDPWDEGARSMLESLENNGQERPVAAPPQGDWVRFLVDRTFSDLLHQQTLDASKDLTNDPVIQMTSIGYFLNKEQIRPAVERFVNAYSQLGGLPDLGVQLAWYLTRTEQAKAGEAIARAVLVRHPDNARMQSVLGVALAKQGRFEEALSPLAEALRLNPNTAATSYHMGWALANLDRPDEAANYFGRAVQINPDLVKAHLGLARAYTALGKDALAAKHIGEAIRAKQNDPQAHREWAVASFLKKDYATAWKHVRECQRLGGWLHPGFLRELRAKMSPPPR